MSHALLQILINVRVKISRMPYLFSLALDTALFLSIPELQHKAPFRA